MRILLVDDEDLQLLRLENEVKKALGNSAELFSYKNPLDALKDHRSSVIDIAFLDIEMPGLNGVN